MTIEHFGNGIVRIRSSQGFRLGSALLISTLLPGCITSPMTQIDPPNLEPEGREQAVAPDSVIKYSESERLPIGEATHVTITDDKGNTLFDDRPRTDQTYIVSIPEDGKLFVTTHWSGGLPTRQELIQPQQKGGPARVAIRWVENAKQYTTARETVLVGGQQRPAGAVPADVEKIEVLKGPSGAEFGSSATAGTAPQASKQGKAIGAEKTGASTGQPAAQGWMVGMGLTYTDRNVAVTGNVPTVTSGIVNLDNTALNLFAEYRQALGHSFALGAQTYDTFWFGRAQYNFNDDDSATPLEFHAPTPGTDTGAGFENPFSLGAGVGARTKLEGSWGIEGTVGLTLSQASLEVTTNEVGEISTFKNDGMIWGLGMNLGVTKKIPGWPAQLVGKVGVNCTEGMEAAGMTRRGFSYVAETGSGCDGAITVDLRASVEQMLRRWRGEYDDDDWPF